MFFFTYSRRLLPLNLPSWPTSTQPFPPHALTEQTLSEFPNIAQLPPLVAASHFHHNPYFGSLQRRTYNPSSILEVDAHPYYGLPDVILLQNYGVVSDMMNDERNLRQKIDNDYHNALIEQEVKRRFSSLMSLGQERATGSPDGFKSRDLMTISSSAYTPNMEPNYRNHEIDFMNQNSGKTFPDIGRYDQQTENFFGKRPEALDNTLNELENRTDPMFSRVTTSSTPNPDLSEQFSDHFVGDTSTVESTDNLFCVSDDRVDVDNLVKENRNNAHAGRAWVNFVNV